MEFRRAVLDNGLEIVAECNPEAHSLGLGFFVRTGARDETDDVAGVSHFLEHMLFKGTPTRTAEDVNREFDEIGAHYNAFTSEESTVYYATVLPEYQAASVDLLADIMRPSLRDEDFEMEKKVILEEIQMYADQPPFGMDDRIKQLHFGAHPLARSVLGTLASVEAISVEQMRAYFAARYTPANVFVVASGRVDFDGLVKQVAQRCDAWQAVPSERPIPPAATTPQTEVVCRDVSHQQYLLQLADAPAAEDSLRYAAKILATIIGDDSGSRLYWDMVDPGLAESASVGHYEYQGAGMYFTWICCTPETADENFAILQRIQHDVERHGVQPAELKQAQSKIMARVVLGGERPRNRLFSVGGNWLQRREYRTVADDLKTVEEVELDDLQQVLAQYPPSRATTISVGPLDRLAGAAAARE